MSHVTTIELEIKDLDALERAAGRCGLVLNRQQATYAWYGATNEDDDRDARERHHRVPEGFTMGDLGRCDHALALDGEAEGYEIGVVRRRDGGDGYVLLADFYDASLVEAVGLDCGLLKQAYATEVAIAELQLKGFAVEEVQLDNGCVEIQATAMAGGLSALGGSG